MSTDQDLQDFDDAFDNDVRNINAATAGPWASELNELLQQSGQAVTNGTPGVASTATYQQLITLVSRASATNLSEAELKERIEGLGATAVNIAKTIQGLAVLFP